MMHMMLVTNLGPSPLDPPPLCPFSSLSIPATCCISLCFCAFIAHLSGKSDAWLFVLLAQPALGHMCTGSGFICHRWTTYSFDDNNNNTCHIPVRALDSCLLVHSSGPPIRNLPCTAPPTCLHWMHAWAHALFPSPLPFLTLPHHWVIWLVWMTRTGWFITLLWPIMLLLPFALLLHTTLPLPSST